MLISFAMLTWNRHKFLKATLEAIFSSLSGAYEYEFLIWDNGSTDETEQVLSAFEARPGVTVIRSKKNRSINAYKPLFNRAKGDVIIEIDDDILQLPHGFDKAVVEYLDAFPDYGYLSLNVVQNEMTTGAKPPDSCYTPDTRGARTVEEGPAGGWCVGFRRSDYRKVLPFFNLIPLSMKRGEDGILPYLFRVFLKRRRGIIREVVCLHATGPAFAKLYGQLDREIEKYRIAGLDEHVRLFRESAGPETPSAEDRP